MTELNISNTSLKDIPPLSEHSIKVLNVSRNYIRNLWDEDIPQGLEDLNLEMNEIRSDGLLVNWPDTLITLNLSYNPIRSFDQVEHWSHNLKTLNLSNTNLDGIFRGILLPDSLEHLDISHTSITHIHILPKSLKVLKAEKAWLRILPQSMPDSLEECLVGHNFIKNGGLPTNWGHL